MADTDLCTAEEQRQIERESRHFGLRALCGGIPINTGQRIKLGQLGCLHNTEDHPCHQQSAQEMQAIEKLEQLVCPVPLAGLSLL